MTRVSFDRQEFPPLRVTVSQPDRMEPGITLLSVRRRVPGQPELGLRYGLLLALDARGEVVWQYRTDVRLSDVVRLRNGNLLYLTADHQAVEIDLLGKVAASWYAAGRPQGPAAGVPVDTLTFHHAVEELPGGNLLVLGTDLQEIDHYPTSDTDPHAPRETARVMGDEIVEFRRDGAVVWRWNAFDWLDPRRIGYDTFFPYWPHREFPGACDWTHGNGLYYIQEQDAVILSLRLQDAVLQLNRETGEIQWIAGDGSGWPERLAGRLLKPAGGMRWFYHQHGPSLTPAGTLLLFDNGNHLARPFRPPAPLAQTYSRAVEYAVDPVQGIAREVWSSDRPGPDAVAAIAMGGARWLPQTGNVLVAYGMCVPQGNPEVRWDNALQFTPWTRVREFTHTDPPQVVWELVLRDDAERDAVGWGVFSAQRLPGMGV